MEQLMVISAVGGEPTAVVQELTRVIMDCGGNIKESRIASFGSDVAMLLLVSGNWHTVSRMERELTRFANSNGVTMQFKRTEPRRFGKELLPYAVDVVGPRSTRRRRT
jgi:glycine cleavage system transcriptional repressor